MAKDNRLYATLTINFASHPKIAVLSDAAFRAVVEMILWSREQLTDGRLTKAYAEHRWGQPVLDELCTNHPDRPTLTRVGGGDYVLHDYSEHQITTTEISAIRKQEISRQRAAAGRASGQARRTKREQTRTNAEQQPEQNINQNTCQPAEIAEQTNNSEHRVRVRDRDRDFGGSFERASYVSSNTASEHARNAELALSERNNLSPPVSIGATRLVSAIVSDKIGDADRTILRIKASEALHQGRSDDDVADCLRVWLTKPELGPHALLCCLSEVDKRKLTHSTPSTVDAKALGWLAKGTTP